MIAVAHHDVEVGIVFVVQDADNLVVEVEFLFGRVLVILNSTYFARSHMGSESSF